MGDAISGFRSAGDAKLMLGLRITHLIALGRSKPPARLNFGQGLNVIFGAANTGKTHVLHLIDFALGASNPPEAPPEQLGYEGIMLGMEALGGETWTLCRSLNGGDIRKLDGLHEDWPAENEGTTLGASHRAANSLSKFLLEKLGMTGVRLRRNAKGDLQDLSFRNLAHLVLVPEGKIQSEVSPVETGQYVSRTVEFSLFKYLLTGVDDSSIQVPDRQQRDRTRTAAKLELLDAQISEAEQSIKNFAEEREDLGIRQSRLDETMDAALRDWDEASVDYRQLSGRRRRLRGEQEACFDRNDEIELLLARFDLLARHYGSDLNRLQAIEEAASIFAALDDGPCPWCGADHSHRGERADVLCEGNTEAVRAAAEAERGKIEIKRGELEETILELQAERTEIASRLPSIDEQLSNLDQQIRQELPDIQEAKTRIAQIVAQRDATQGGLARFDNLDRLKEMRLELVGDTEVDSVALIAEGGVDPTVLDQFAENIERFLTSWSFPAQRVFFDLPRRDIQVSGKPRRVNGKGVRAVLHAAFSLGLLAFTCQREKPHPRFLILDSPLVTYRDPMTPEDVSLAHSDLNERFYEPFRNWDSRLQVIVIENRDPPQWVSESGMVERFTGTSSFGRAGFYL
jgi:hypothetical protein